MTAYCKECREEFGPDEQNNGFCSWDCEADASAADAEHNEFGQIYDEARYGSAVVWIP